jgi:hypothetical protein
VIILTAVCRNKREFRGVALAGLAAILLMLLSGDRTGPLTVMAMVAAALYLKRSEGWPIQWNWKKVAALVVVMLILIPMIQNLRRIPIRLWSVDNVASAATQGDAPESVRLGILGDTLVSTSTSLETFVGTISLLETTEPYRYGFDYLRPFVVAIPFHSRLLDLLDVRFNERGPSIYSQPTWWITYHFNYRGKSGLGYLQLAEAYLQFGASGVLGLYLMLGYFLTDGWKRVQNHTLAPQKLALLLIGFTGILIWVRNDASGVLRNVFWAWLIIYLWPSLSHGRFPIRRKRIEQSTNSLPVGLSR